MKAVLLRRTKDSTIDGKPILTLPDKTIEMVYAVLSPDEQQFYQALQDKSKILYNRYLRAGTVGRNYSNILVLLLRLRQACCHPHLIRDIEDADAKKPFDDQMIELAKSLSPEAVARLKDPSDAFECPICLDAADNPSIVIPCGHRFCSECLLRLHTQHVEAAIASGNEESGARCPGCRGVFQLNKVIDLRTFQKVHSSEGEEAAPEEPKEEYDDLIYDTDSSFEDSDDDDDTGSDLEDFVVKDEEEDEEDSEEDSEDQGESSAAASASEDGGQAPVQKAAAPKKKKDLKGKGKAKEKRRPRTLAEVRKDAMRNGKSKRQCMFPPISCWLVVERD